jgi:hypothetical protein
MIKPALQNHPPSCCWGWGQSWRGFATAVALLLLPLRPGLAEEGIRVYHGLCDASAAETLGAGFFVVADDEDNILRIYDRAGGGLPVASLDLSRFLQTDPKHPEADLEGAARLGNLIYWITSHGRNADGKRRASRHRFFATEVTVSNGVPGLTTVGQPYTRLLQDLIGNPRLARFGLAAAAQLPPKHPGALNIEGLAPSPAGHLWIGFRNPIPREGALLVPMLNPEEVIHGARPRLGDPLLLPLGGLGIRSITDWGSQYLIVAGSYDGEGRSELYRWNGSEAAPQLLHHSALKGLNAEALARFPGVRPGEEELLVISDDGNVPIGGKPCKKLTDPREKQFRARIVAAAEIERP